MGASAIAVERDKERETRKESGSSTSNHEDMAENVCPEQNTSSLDSIKEDTAKSASGTDVEEDEVDGTDAVEDGETEEQEEEEEPDRRSPLSHWEEILDLDSMADNATTLAETI